MSPEFEQDTLDRISRGRNVGKLPRFNLLPTCIDTERFDFRIVISAAANFQPDYAQLCPSDLVPPREKNEYQTWVSVDDEPIPEILGRFKRFLMAEIHHRPGITLVSSFILSALTL